MDDLGNVLTRARGGDALALDDLFQALYPELRRLAHAKLAPHARSTMLDTTVLVHECYLKFSAASQLPPQDRAHFLAYSARVMRSVIVDLARAGQAQRRGGDALHVTLGTEVAESVPQPEEDVLHVDEALKQLAELDPRLAQVVEMRYFGGMTEADIAAVLGVTDRTVRRDWEKARLLLAAALRG
jgi:RNA polymerase sigma factor (TIGR02999 family)